METYREPEYRNIVSAWARLRRDMPGLGDLERAIFMAGATAAMAIAWHYGWNALREDLEREHASIEEKGKGL